MNPKNNTHSKHTREPEIDLKRVGLLATGDEISHGDILNTNSQTTAAKLTHNGIDVGMHLTVSDNMHDITTALKFLLAHHDAIIITGGLGPTEDDLTRFALAETIQQELCFDEKIWEYICERIKKYGFKTLPESNKRQALFPKNAEIIPNPHGTAAGCFVIYRDKQIFMLPGPPYECLPMIESFVLPKLLNAHFQKTHFHQHWLLFGVSEGQIAEELEKLVKGSACTTGYRIAYPYVEFKLNSNNKKDFDHLIPIILQHIQPYLVGDGNENASTQLQKMLKNIALKQPHFQLYIQDDATGGALENTLKTPENLNYLFFVNHPNINTKSATNNHSNISTKSAANNNPHTTFFVNITGLAEYWHPPIDSSGSQLASSTQPRTVQNKSVATLQIQITANNLSHEDKIKMPLHKDRIKLFAVEWICKQLLTQIPVKK